MLVKELEKELKAGFESSDVSLRGFCEFTGLTYQVILRESKKPIVGEIYNPENVNYLQMSQSILSKYPKFESVDFNLIKVKKAASQSNITFNVGDQVEFRNFKGKYEILMKTIDHVVFVEINGTKPRVMNNDTFDHQGPRMIG